MTLDSSCDCRLVTVLLTVLRSPYHLFGVLMATSRRKAAELPPPIEPELSLLFPNGTAPNGGTTARTLEMLVLACEQHRCAITIIGRAIIGSHSPPLDIATVNFALSVRRPLMRAVIINGALYVMGFDAGSLLTRERERLLSIARHCANG